MAILFLTIADLKPLCGLEMGNTASDAALSALLLGPQAALEYALDPGVLAASAGDAGLRATLTLGAAEALAGEYLRRQARVTGATDDFHLGPLTISASRTDSLAQMGERLAAAGQKRLEPFGRAARRVVYDASGGVPDDSSQSALVLQAEVAASCLHTRSLFGDHEADDLAWRERL